MKNMNVQAGRTFSIAAENRPVPGCTISGNIGGNHEITIFSLAAGTDISAENYRTHKLWIAAQGPMTTLGNDGKERIIREGDLFVTPVDTPIGVKTDAGAVYTEISLKEESAMNQVLKAGEVFNLKDLLPYQEGKIINMDLINDPSMKLVLMSFDAGTGLSEHAAPGEALIFALDGEAVIGYEGEQHRIHAGETFKFDKLGRHSVLADHKFKMALLLELG